MSLEISDEEVAGESLLGSGEDDLDLSLPVAVFVPKSVSTNTVHPTSTQCNCVCEHYDSEGVSVAGPAWGGPGIQYVPHSAANLN